MTGHACLLLLLLLLLSTLPRVMQVTAKVADVSVSPSLPTAALLAFAGIMPGMGALLCVRKQAGLSALPPPCCHSVIVTLCSLSDVISGLSDMRTLWLLLCMQRLTTQLLCMGCCCVALAVWARAAFGPCRHACHAGSSGMCHKLPCLSGVGAC